MGKKSKALLLCAVIVLNLLAPVWVNAAPAVQMPEQRQVKQSDYYEEAARIILNYYRATLVTGNSFTLEARVINNRGMESSIPVEWNSSNPYVASVDPSVGVVRGNHAGTAVITASAGYVTAKCEITVRNPVRVSRIRLSSGSKTISAGKTFTLVPTLYPSNPDNPKITWKSSNTKAATVTQEGLVTAKKAGVAYITAVTDDGGKTAKCKVVVQGLKGGQKNWQYSFATSKYNKQGKISISVKGDNFKISGNSAKGQTLLLNILRVKSQSANGGWSGSYVVIESESFSNKTAQINVSKVLNDKKIKDGTYMLSAYILSSSWQRIASTPYIGMKVTKGEIYFIRPASFEANTRLLASLKAQDKNSFIGLSGIPGYWLGGGRDVNDTGVQAIVKKAKALVKGKKDPLQKTEIIHNWVSQNIYYDYDIYEDRASYMPDVQTAFKLKRGVCEDYARITTIMLRSVGVPCAYIRGNASPYFLGRDFSDNLNLHAWNAVYIDGKWHYMDTTHDSLNRYEHGKYITDKKNSYTNFLIPVDMASHKMKGSAFM